MSEPREFITAEIRLAWWFPMYCAGLRFFSELFDCEPDWEKFEAVVEKAIRIKEV